MSKIYNDAKYKNVEAIEIYAFDLYGQGDITYALKDYFSGSGIRSLNDIPKELRFTSSELEEAFKNGQVRVYTNPNKSSFMQALAFKYETTKFDPLGGQSEDDVTFGVCKYYIPASSYPGSSKSASKLQKLYAWPDN